MAKAVQVSTLKRAHCLSVTRLPALLALAYLPSESAIYRALDFLHYVTGNSMMNAVPLPISERAVIVPP